MEVLNRNQRKKLEEIAFNENGSWNRMPNIQNEKARDFYKEKLWQTIQAAQKNPFPNSHAEANPDMPDSDIDFDYKDVHRRYTEVLPEYGTTSRENSKYFFGGEQNIGYKLRLNVAVADVKKVSEYLKSKGLDHKFLHGADGAGEVFTVYTGSKDRTDAVAQILSEDLKTELRMPVGVKEIEFAPNVAGYFVSPNNPLGLGKNGVEFSRYPAYKKQMRGIPCVKGFEIATNLPREKIYGVSYDHLATIFGTYFYGTTEPSFDELFDLKLSGTFKG